MQERPKYRGDEATLDGWCGVGSIVRSDFYIDAAEVPRRVTRICPHAGTDDALVWADRGEKGEAEHELSSVDFRQWIKRP